MTMHQHFLTNGTVSTHDWDCVSAVQVLDVNAAISGAGTSPQSFQQKIDDTIVQAKFGDWTMCEGGDGKNIHMRLPFRDLVISDEDGTREIGAGQAEISLCFDFIPHDTLGDDTVEVRCLMVSRDVDAEGFRPVSVIDVDYDQRPFVVDRAAVTGGLGMWLQENLLTFAHVFAVVNIAKSVAEDEAFSWLRPTYATYAYCAHDGLSDDTFAVLCQTAGRTGDALVPELSPGAIRPGDRAALLVSPERVLSDMIAPSLPVAFPGLPQDAVEVDAKNLALSFRGAAQLHDLKVDGKSYNPVLEKMDVSLLNTALDMSLQTSTPIIPGVDSVTNASSRSAIKLDKNKKGEKTLSFEEISKPDPISHTRHAKGMIIAEIILGIIMAVAAAIGIVVTGGLAAVPAYLVTAALIGGTLATAGQMFILVADMVADGNGPGLSGLLAQAGTDVIWPHGAILDPANAGLVGPLQISGTLQLPDDRMKSANPFAEFQAIYGPKEEMTDEV